MADEPKEQQPSPVPAGDKPASTPAATPPAKPAAAAPGATPPRPAAPVPPKPPVQLQTPLNNELVGRIRAKFGTALVEASEDKRRRTLTRKITSFRNQGRHYRRTDETHVVRLYKIAELEEDLRGIGFRTKAARGYGSMSLRPATAVIYAGKPAVKPKL